MPMKPCIVCGEPSPQTRCEEHKVKRPNTTRTRNNPTRWKRMSARLRAMQPWCSVCGTAENLTVDHIIPVSKRSDLEYEVSNFQILCRSHNAQKGTTTIAFIEPVEKVGDNPSRPASPVRRLAAERDTPPREG